jgi:hypothetical protein
METTGTDRIAALKGGATVTTAVLIAMLAADRAFAADSTTTTTATTTTSSRRLAVSIPDRKLAVIENGAVVTVFPVAVGAAATPSPVGTFTIVNRVSNPTYYKSGDRVRRGDVVELHAERTSEISRLFDESLPTAPQPEAR